MRRCDRRKDRVRRRVVPRVGRSLDLGRVLEVLLDELLHHGVELLGLVEHDHVAGERDELEVRLGDRPLHLAHLHQRDEGVLQPVDQERRNGDSTVEGRVACKTRK